MKSTLRQRLPSEIELGGIQSAVCVCVHVCVWCVPVMRSDSCHDCFYECIHTHIHTYTHAQPQLPSALKDVLIKLQLCPAAGPRDIERG